MRQTKISFVLLWARAPRLKKRKRRKKRKKKWEKTKQMYVFILKSCVILVFWMSRVFGMNFPWRLVAPCSRVLGRDHPNPRILEVLWEKP